MTRTIPTTNRRRVAMLGAGYIAKFHAEAVRTLNDVDLCAVCDLSQMKAEALADSYGIPKVYTSLDAMLAAERLDAVHVLLPPEHHAPSVIKILQAGVDVLAEKPLSVSSEECRQLAEKAKEHGRLLGVSHNFLFSPVYERLTADLTERRLGKIDQIDIVWNKPLGQLAGGPFGGWLFAQPDHVLFEVGPHTFGHLAHVLGGDLDDLTVLPTDRITLPQGRTFYRCWEALGHKGHTSVRLRFSFIDGYAQHYIKVRGRSGAAMVDFEQDTYVRTEHTAQLLDVDRYANVAAAAVTTVRQAGDTLARFLLAKMGLATEGAPFQRSITRCVRAFYEGVEDGSLDERMGPELATRAVALAERVRDAAGLRAPADASETARERTDDASETARERTDEAAPATVLVRPPVLAARATPRIGKAKKETVLVLGGTGFIGQALVRKLHEAGHGVRLLARSPSAVPPLLLQLGVSVVKGDVADIASVGAALDGIRCVYHLARGTGETWADYLRSDVEPSRRLAELCVARGVEKLFYTSSIAIYYAGKRAGTITESTAPNDGVMRSNLYARAKVEIERELLRLHKESGLQVVIFRPGIVLGRGGNPLHGGVAGFPFSSVSRLFGEGHAPLPIVLVDDCADAMVRALDVPNLGGESFNLVGEPCLTAHEYLDEVERAAGLKFRRVPTSSFRYFAEDVGKYLIKTVGRDPHRRLPSYASWDGRTCEAYFDGSHARKMLAWEPTSDRAHLIREGIAAPAAQFLS